MTQYYRSRSVDSYGFRPSLTGPIALFGRGRLLSFLFMVTVTLFSYVSKNSDGIDPTGAAAQQFAGFYPPSMLGSAAGPRNLQPVAARNTNGQNLGGYAPATVGYPSPSSQWYAQQGYSQTPSGVAPEYAATRAVAPTPGYDPRSQVYAQPTTYASTQQTYPLATERYPSNAMVPTRPLTTNSYSPSTDPSYASTNAPYKSLFSDSDTTRQSSDPVVRHGGRVEDARTIELRDIGAKLVRTLPHLSSNAVRFYLLRDSRVSATYALTDGSVLVTAAAFDACTTEDAVAGLLSDRITDVVFQGYERNEQQVDQYASQLLTTAGYDPRVRRSRQNVAWR